MARNNSFCQHVVQDTAEFGENHFECRPEARWDIMIGKHGGIYTCTVSNMSCRLWHMATWLYRRAHALDAGGNAGEK